MRILFLHPNFPGQFKHLAKAAAEAGHDVKFICQTHYGRQIDKVERLKLKGKNSHEALGRESLTLSERSARMADQFRSGFLSLKKDAWNPDIVISHSGWGCGFFTKEIWPTTKHITYLEWWFNPLSEFFTYDEFNKDIGLNRNSIKKHWVRNQYISHETASSDAIVSPTFWQREQLPTILKNNCHVIFDGVDVSNFTPNKNLRRPKPLITYGTRGMDPFRGFPQFIKSLPLIASKLGDNIEIEIAGNNEVYYGSAPKNFNNWQEWAIRFCDEQKISSKISWKGFLNGKNYINWLQSSWCHVYLSHPFIASWSLLDALAVGCPLVVSDVGNVRDICKGHDGIKYVDHRDSSQIGTACSNEILDSTYNGQKIYERNLREYSIENSLKRWEAVTGVDLTTTR